MLPRIIIALDFRETKQVEQFLEGIDPARVMLKIGKELFTRTGPDLVTKLINKGFKIFLDLKFHDIPNQVANACAVAADLGVSIVDVHALGGRKMLEAASNALAKCQGVRPLLIGVTILTSMTEDDLFEIGLKLPMPEAVTRLALLCKESGLNGVVCSANEASMLKKACGSDFILVTPGIRLEDDSATGFANVNDQKRVMTPKEAIKAGADFLVIGRPITQATNPMSVLNQIESDIK